MSEKGKRFGKDISLNATEKSTPIKVVVKGTRKVKVPAEDSVTELDEPIIPQKTGNTKAAPAEAKWVLKDPAVVGLALGSDNKPVQPIPAMSRPKPRPFKEPKLPMATSAPKEVASKPASNPRPSNKKLDKPQPKLSKARPPKAKSELSMAREALKKAQENMKKAQEVQKKAREETRRLRDILEEPGVHNQIKVVNNKENVKAQSLHPPHLSHSLNNNKSSTYQGKVQCQSKQTPI